MEKIKWQELKVGQPVVVCNSGYGSYITYQFGYVIEKITPTGQITVKYTNGSKRRFDNRGWEFGAGSIWNREWLDTDIAGARKAVAERNIVDAAVSLINEITKFGVLNYGSHKETVLDRIKIIQIKLNDAKKILEGANQK